MNNKNIVLVQFKLPGNNPPLGILYIGNALEKAGYNVTICHFDSSEIKKIELLIEELRPIFIGVSTFTSHTLPPSIELSKNIKQAYSHMPIIWGGVHPSLFAKECLSEDFIDIVVVGEGEKNIIEVARKLEEGKSLEGIPGIGFKDSGEVVFVEKSDFYRELDEYTPSWHLIDIENCLKELFGKKRVLSLITSRGCPFRCSFCWNINFYKRLWRAHSAEMVVHEVKCLTEKYALDGVCFEDSNFFTDKKRVFQIIENINVSWGGSIRANVLNDEVMTKFKENGCELLFVGAESGSQRVLDLIHKDIKVEDIINAARLCDKYKILGMFSFIVGIPGEKKEDVYQTMELISKLKKEFPSIRVYGPKLFTPYPGAESYDDAVELGFVPPKNLEEWAMFTRNKCHLPWIKNKREVESLQFINKLAHNNPKRLLGKIVQKIEAFRWNRKILFFPIELILLSFFYNNKWINSVLMKIYGDDGNTLAQ